MNEQLSREKLIEKAKRLGIDTKGDPIYASSAGRHEFADEYELHEGLWKKSLTTVPISFIY